jgi:hypothetical protein
MAIRKTRNLRQMLGGQLDFEPAFVVSHTHLCRTVKILKSWGLGKQNASPGRHSFMFHSAESERPADDQGAGGIPVQRQGESRHPG